MPFILTSSVSYENKKFLAEMLPEIGALRSGDYFLSFDRSGTIHKHYTMLTL